MNQEYIIAYADKCVLKISGMQIKGLNTLEVERILSDKLQCLVRVIGVTGSDLELDLYDISPETVRKSAQGLIEAVSLAEGITATEVTRLSCSERIVEVDYDQIMDYSVSDCAKERWMKKE